MKRYHTYLAENQRVEMGLAEAQSVLVKYKIGDGGFGEVWRVSHIAQPKNYALKHINVPRLIDMQRIGPDDRGILIERIKREASVRVASEYVVKCHGYREIEGNFFLLSDFVAGENLRFWISDHLEMGWPAKKAMFLKILHGVRDLHRAGIVHRDLKPSNILVTLESQVPKIIDFGLAKLDDSTLTMTGDFSGSKFYKDPGLIRAWEGIKAVDQTSDVYALGILLYEMIMGQNPWHANQLPYEELFNQIAGQEHILDIDRRFQLDAPPQEVDAVKELLRISTRFDRSARAQSIDEMLGCLGEAEGEVPKRPAPSVSRPPQASDAPSSSPPPPESVSAPRQAAQTFLGSDRRPPVEPPTAPKPFEHTPTPPQTSPRRAAKKSATLPIVIVTLALLAGGAYFWRDALGGMFRAQSPIPTPTTTRPPRRQATPTPTPTRDAWPSATSQSQGTASVADMLARAEDYLDASQFTSPQGENAFETYQRVLAVDPSNSEAKEGLLYMLNTYVQWIDGNCLKGRGYYPHFQQIAAYIHGTLRDRQLQAEAFRVEQALPNCDWE